MSPKSLKKVALYLEYIAFVLRRDAEGKDKEAAPEPSAVPHVVILGYTNDDDGVHLECSCGWSLNVGYECTAARAAELSNTHIAGPKP